MKQSSTFWALILNWHSNTLVTSQPCSCGWEMLLPWWVMWEATFKYIWKVIFNSCNSCYTTHQTHTHRTWDSSLSPVSCPLHPRISHIPFQIQSLSTCKLHKRSTSKVTAEDRGYLAPGRWDRTERWAIGCGWRSSGARLSGFRRCLSHFLPISSWAKCWVFLGLSLNKETTVLALWRQLTDSIHMEHLEQCLWCGLCLISINYHCQGSHMSPLRTQLKPTRENKW